MNVLLFMIVDKCFVLIVFIYDHVLTLAATYRGKVSIVRKERKKVIVIRKKNYCLHVYKKKRERNDITN